MSQDGALFAMDLDGFWMDVGQPKDFLAGLKLYLAVAARRSPELFHPGSKESCVSGHVLIHPTAKVGKGCRIGPNVAIGANVVIEDGVRIVSSTIFEGALIKSHSWINNSIVGWNCRIGRWARLDGVSVLGDDVTVEDEIYINGGTILPHKSISGNICDPQIVM
jgi:mannose-1-phosphate guanylyltransferase